MRGASWPALERARVLAVQRLADRLLFSFVDYHCFAGFCGAAYNFAPT